MPFQIGDYVRVPFSGKRHTVLRVELEDGQTWVWTDCEEHSEYNAKDLRPWERRERHGDCND